MAVDDVTLDRYLKGRARVVFMKKDGSVREMICTTNLALVPADLHPKGSGKFNINVQRVFDLELNEWRSFYKSYLMSVEVAQ
jgi:hypothetical protein